MIGPTLVASSPHSPFPNMNLESSKPFFPFKAFFFRSPYATGASKGETLVVVWRTLFVI